jgi:hypothetical protein
VHLELPGVVASIPSARLTNATPSAFRSSSSVMRRFSDLPNLSKSDVAITVENDAIVIRRHRMANEARVRAAATKVFQKRRRLMQRLAK